MTSNKFKLQMWHIVSFLYMCFDLFVINLSYFLALAIEYGFHLSTIPNRYVHILYYVIPIYSLICVTAFLFFKVYNVIYRLISIYNTIRLTIILFAFNLFTVITISLFIERMPPSFFIIGGLLQFIIILSVRTVRKIIATMIEGRCNNEESENIMIVGAGLSGQKILRDIRSMPNNCFHVCCFIDDDANKKKRLVDNIPIVGDRDSILSAAKKYSIKKIFIAIPSISQEDKLDILNHCKETGCQTKIVPDIKAFLDRPFAISDVRNIMVEDLLERPPIQINLDEVYNYINGKVVLVTGGGGSIGSELCRQVAAHSPKQLIIFDIYENNAYAIQIELRRKYPDLNLVTLIGSVRDSRRIFSVFEEYHPDICYHAAAHKHVPLMEDNPCESIKNNTFGTYKTAIAAMVHNTKKFVLISTDKAVNPTNIMGASKRLCEMIIQTFNELIKENRTQELPLFFSHKDDDWSLNSYLSDLKNCSTEFVAVRFGNVLGSNGSVIPLFNDQIAKGGPITVTDKKIIRYFMLIPEAVSLVMLAGIYAKGGEIFVLDMGKPVSIDSLARNLIKLYGLKPDVDIQIVYTGLRPGEKLYEEKLMSEEGLRKTKNSLIHIGCPIPFDKKLFLSSLDKLFDKSQNNDAEHIRKIVQMIVPTYNPNSSTSQQSATSK